MDFITDIISAIGTVLAVIGIIIALIIFIRLCYKKVPPNQAFIISGFYKKPRIVSGRAVFIIPMIQRIDKINLGLIQSNIITSAPVPTADFIEVSVSAVVNFQISAEPDQREKATRNFLNFSKDDISKIASEVLEGSMREIIGQMYIKDMVTDRETFNTRVIQTAKPDLNNMGLDLISFNVQNFQDGRGVIEKLGMDQTAQITRDAAIAKIEADREVELKAADARNATNERNIRSDLEIAQREQQLAVTRANLQIEQDTRKAEADLAYQIQTETKGRELEIAKQEAAIAKQGKEIELKEREVLITERKLEAEIKKRAEADRYAKQQAAEASLFEVQRRAEAEKAQADAERYKIEANAEAQAVLGKAEASVIEAKGQAGARSTELQGFAIANALKEQANAYNSMNNPYVLLEKYIEVLPLIAQAIADPLSRVGNITMYGEGNVAKLVEETTRTTTQLNAALAESLGFDIQSMLNGMITGRAIGNGISSSSSEYYSTEQEGLSPKASQKPLDTRVSQGSRSGKGQAGRSASGSTGASNKGNNASDSEPHIADFSAFSPQKASAIMDTFAKNYKPSDYVVTAQTPYTGVATATTLESTPSGRSIVEQLARNPASIDDVLDAPLNDEITAEVLEAAFEKDIIAAQGSEREKVQLANSITQAYALTKKLKYDPLTSQKVQGVVLKSLNEVDLSTLRSKKEVAAFIKNKLLPNLLDTR